MAIMVFTVVLLYYCVRPISVGVWGRGRVGGGGVVVGGRGVTDIDISCTGMEVYIYKDMY